ncbi:ankyrin repeat-containing domain protein [Xylaria sp. FL0064]|nr:ankyrin repeat-containing domain protein [Xylaria sp. FL0064]
MRRYGGTALYGTVYRMHTPVVKLLLEAGADINKADFLNVTPLHTAATLGNVELLKLLLDFSANRDAIDGMGESPIDWVHKSGQFQMQDLLLGHEIKDDKDPQVTIAIDANPDGVWEASSATIPYFPGFHGHRSGMRSSIIVQVKRSFIFQCIIYRQSSQLSLHDYVLLVS